MQITIARSVRVASALHFRLSFAALARFFVALFHKLCVYFCGSNLIVNRVRAITPAEFAVEAIADVRVFSLILVVVSLLSSLALILKLGAALLNVT